MPAVTIYEDRLERIEPRGKWIPVIIKRLAQVLVQVLGERGWFFIGKDGGFLLPITLPKFAEWRLSKGLLGFILLMLLVPGEGFEPPTFGLQNRCTATVLTRRRRIVFIAPRRAASSRPAARATGGAGIRQPFPAR